MEAVTWNEVRYKQATLPKLRMTQEISRRDSITSSKSRDSGYNSEPDISLSPLEFVHPEKGVWCPDPSGVLPAVPFILIDPIEADVDEIVHPAWARPLSNNVHGSVLVKHPKRAPTQNIGITSDPGSSKCALAVKYSKSTNFESLPRTSNAEPVEPTYSEENLLISGAKGVERSFDDPIPSHNTSKKRLSSVQSFTSTSSCGDYSVTDDSDYEESSDQRVSMLSKATLKTIELIMRKIEVNLAYVAYVQCANGQSAKASAAGDTVRGRRGSAQGSARKRKARNNDGLLPEDEEEDGVNKRRRVSVTTTEDSENGPRFACPFYKHDPNRYRNRRTCPGPGWPTVHRMKEHLYRSHEQPIYCPRCYMVFESDNDLSIHLRSNPCRMSTPQPIEGIDRETLFNLRRRSAPLRLEEDKWRDAYQLLFPNTAEADIPSPYYDSDSPTEESRRFRRELLQRIEQELFATAEQTTGAVEQNLLRQVAGIIRRCEHDLLNSFNPASGSLQPSLGNGPPPPPVTPNVYQGSAQGPAQPPHVVVLPTPLYSPVGRGHIAEDITGEADLQYTMPPAQPPVWYPTTDLVDLEALFSDMQGAGPADMVPMFTTPVWSRE